MIRGLLTTALLAMAAPASAGIVLTFDEIPNYNRPSNFYDGGSFLFAGNGSPGPVVGPDLGVVIGDAAFIYQAFDQCPEGGCGGIFPAAPGIGYRALYNFPDSSTGPQLSTINVAAGFVGEASVWHYGGFSAMTVYQGLGGRFGGGGNPPTLGRIEMPATTGCTVNPNTLTVTGCGWTKYTIAFDGVAQSLELAGGAAYFDNVSLGASGSVGGVPEPASWALLIAGFGLTGAAMRRRRAALG